MISMNSVARTYSLVLGAILLILGLLGWIPALAPGGHFLGLFSLNPVHNLVHLLTGLVGLGAGVLLLDRSVRLYTLTMAVVYGLVAVAGYLQAGVLSVLAVNLADTLLHTAIFVLSLLVALAAFSERRLLARQAALSASLFPQPQPSVQAITAMPPGYPPSGRQRWGSGTPDPAAIELEQLHWQIEHDASVIESLTARERALQQEVARPRHELEMLRALQPPPPGHQTSRPPRQTSGPTAAPTRNGGLIPGHGRANSRRTRNSYRRKHASAASQNSRSRPEWAFHSRASHWSPARSSPP
jgi:hypothetical protein